MRTSLPPALVVLTALVGYGLAGAFAEEPVEGGAEPPQGGEAESARPYRVRSEKHTRISAIWVEWKADERLVEFLADLESWEQERMRRGEEGLLAAGLPGLYHLVDGLRHDQPDPQRAAGAWRILVARGKEAVPGLLEGLFHPDSTVRAASAQLVGRIGADAAPYTQHLIELVEDENSWVRESAVISLGKTGLAADAVLEALSTGLRDWDGDVRAAAASALGALGEGAQPLVGRLLDTLKNDPSGRARAAAGTALLAISRSKETLLPLLVAAAFDRDPEASYGAKAALASWGKEDREILVGLVGGLDDPLRAAAHLEILELATGQPLRTKAEWEAHLGITSGAQDPPADPGTPDGGR